MKKAIIIGASSGIGRELAKIIAANGYIVGLTARRTQLLQDLSAEIPGTVLIKTMDLSKPGEAISRLQELITEMNGVDVIIISAGTGHINPGLAWDLEANTIDVNVTGFAAMANVAWNHFRERGGGTIVGISSIAALRGGAAAPAYNASKAFVSNYLAGLRYKSYQQHAKVKVIDIKPGFVDTEMAQSDKLFWVASPRKAAAQIFQCIQKGKERAYITRRWVLIAWLFQWLPDWLFRRLQK